MSGKIFHPGQHRCQRCRYWTYSLGPHCGPCLNLLELARPEPSATEQEEERQRALTRVTRSLAA